MKNLKKLVAPDKRTPLMNIHQTSESTPIKEDKGNNPGVVLAFENRTEPRRTEEVLRLFEKAIETMQLGLTITNSEGKILYTNPSEAAMHGYQAEELIGKDVRILAPQEIWNPMTTEQLLERKRWRRESINIRQDGSLFPVQLMSVVVKNLSGDTLGVITTCEDITEREEAEKEKKRLQEQLLQSQKMEGIGRLAGGIAHDFNNLLTVIKGYSQLSLELLKEGDPIKENLEEVLRSTDRATDLIRQLLTFSRRQVLAMDVLDLNALITNLEMMLRRVIGEDIALAAVLAKDLGRIKADPGQIEQVILNLAVNARDAMPKGGKLIIETANVELDEDYVRSRFDVSPGHYVRLSLSDTGVGMTPEVRERIFEPFFTTKERGKGTGLGLSTVYGIIKQIGGNIWVYSEPGHGTTFKIYLPRIEEEGESHRTTIAPSRTRQGSETILLVEDEEKVRTLTRTILQNNGYHVWQASNGKEALRIVQEQPDQPVHLMLTDVVMPGMSGRELAESIRSLRPEMKVLYMSGYTDDAIVHHGVLDLGRAFLQKPFSPDSLASKVRDILDGH